MNILAIDPGTSCGFALLAGGGVTSGVWQLAPARGESPGVRYLKLCARLNEARAAAGTLDLVVFEIAFHVLQKSQNAVHIHHSLVGHIESWCATHGVEHAVVYPSTLKKWATGKGNAKKDDMRRIGAQRFAVATMGPDEIDALWVLEWAREHYGQAA